MRTHYSEVFELVLHLMKSYEIDDIYDRLKEQGVTEYCLPYLKIASGELENNNSEIDLSGRDDTTYTFNDRLTDGQQLIIAKHVVIGILTKETLDILQMKLHLQDGDFKTFAEKNNLDGKMNVLIILKEDLNHDIVKRGYNNFKW